MVQFPILQCLALLILVVVAAIGDIRDRRIPNAVTVPGLLVGLLIGSFFEGGLPLHALAGAGLAFLVAFVIYAFGGFGAGDATLLTAVGPFVGPGGVLAVLLYSALAGGVLALFTAIRRGAILGLLISGKNLLLHWITRGRSGHPVNLNRPDAPSLPYGVAIAAGSLMTCFLPFSWMGGT